MVATDRLKPSRTKERTLARLIARIDRSLERAVQTSSGFSRWRMIIFIVGILSSVAVFRLEWYNAGNTLVALFVLTFLTVASYHSRLEKRMHRLRIWRKIKSAHLARLRLDWGQMPRSASPAVEAHPYASDLDLIGPHSLFSLVNTTLSSNGRDRLANWLFDQNEMPPNSDRWLARQTLIKELAPLTLFRDRLVLEATLVGEGEIDGVRMLALLQAPAGFSGLLPVLITESLLAMCTISLALAAAFALLPGYWILSFAAYVVVYFLTSGGAAAAFSRALSVHQELDKLGAIFRYLRNRSPRRTPSLSALCAPLLQGPHEPHRYLRRFARVAHALSIRAHTLVHLALNGLIPWDFWWAYRLERLQRQVLVQIPGWLDTFAELEAAAALANFACLNPEYCWPTLAQPGANGQSATLVATQLGHPLIPSARRVTNNVDLHGLGRLLIITGSNMSGKSTFLRTIGLNACLAQAGAPVCAESFQASWVRIYCCIRVDDSLEAGLSFFYAEVKRLKRVLDAAECHSLPPVLFLIDEIFKGTNNRERIIGSRAFIRALAGSNGFGLVTTHDLELAEMETDIPNASNAHFQESVEAKALTFDYRLRPGPCPTTNALRIMALEGLPVPERDTTDTA